MAFAEDRQTRQAVCDRVEPPPIRPHLTRVHLLDGARGCCCVRSVAEPPVGLEQGSPFDRSIEALVICLHYAQAIGPERLRMLLGELFGLSISEGALSNIVARAKPRLEMAAERIAGQLGASRVMCSDEISARVEGRNWWE